LESTTIVRPKGYQDKVNPETVFIKTRKQIKLARIFPEGMSDGDEE
jgi:hypothetical protein